MAETTPTSTLIIRPAKGWADLGLRELCRARELLWFLIVRDIKSRYRQMALGPLWIVLRPLLGMIIFSLVFGTLAELPSEGVPYPLFTLCALLPWQYFSAAVQQSSGSLVEQMGVISKVYFPRMVVPLSSVLGAVLDLAVALLLLIAVLAYYRVVPPITLVTLPLFALMAVATAAGVGLWIATFAVRFRDVRFVIGYALQGWMYATPVVYSSGLVAERWPWFYRYVYQLNPMFWVAEGFRWAVLGKGVPPSAAMFPAIVLTILLVISGAYVFRRTERTIVDLL